MNRRGFLKNTAISFPMVLGGIHISALGYSQRLARLTNTASETDKVLVLIQLNGGNDGLNTLIPLDQYDNLLEARKNILVPEEQLIKVRRYPLGFHPSFEKIGDLYHNHLVGIIQSVGYPEPNKSHFRSTDIWTSASASSVNDSSGWIGRYLDTEYPGFPQGYPNNDAPDPLAITVGSLVSNTCQGPAVNMSIPVNNLSSFDQLTGGTDGSLPDSVYGNELGFIRESIRQTNAYNTVLSDAVKKGSNKVSYPSRSENKLAYQLGIVSKLISSGLKTRVYVVNLGGFDTHSTQVDLSDNTQGEHASLLKKLSESVHLFMEDLEAQKLNDKVVAMTFSEFGRRIKSNESSGTDHGEAAPMFFFGSQVNPMVFGTNPVIEKGISSKDNIPMQYDFRSVYGSVLQDWFGTSSTEIKSLLNTDYKYIPILRRGAIVTGIDETIDLEYLEQNYPNPFNSVTSIPFKSLGGKVEMRLYNQRGQMVRLLIDKYVARGNHNFTLNKNGLKAGVYIYELKIKTGSYKKTLIVN